MDRSGILMKRIISPALVLLMMVLFADAVSAQTEKVKHETAGLQKDPTGSAVADLERPDQKYRIGFQDIVDINVHRHPDLSQRVPVNANGAIVLFRLERPVVAVCKTERELADEIAKAYKENYLRDPQVNVVVAEQKSQYVAVMGAVERPGNFYVNRRFHLLEMLALAGGPNKEAGTRLLVARTGSPFNCSDTESRNDDENISVVGFKVRDIQEGKQHYWLEPGDVVTVLDADLIYVYGNVNKQGVYKVKEPITLTQAIVSAEGLKATAQKENIRILREMPGSIDRVEIVADLRKIEKGKAPDILLEPNDIVAVSQDRAKSILHGFVDTLKNSVPNTLYRIP